MIQENMLMPGVEFRIKNGAQYKPQHIQQLIQQKTDSYGVPVAFKTEYITEDLMTRLLRSKEECTILYNPEKKDGLRYVIRFNTQGTYLFIQVNKTNGYPLDSARFRAAEAVRSLYPKENHWYTIIDDIFEELFT